MNTRCLCGHARDWHVSDGCVPSCGCRAFRTTVAAPVAVRRVWREGDPEPRDVVCVRDSQGDVWTCDVRGVWWTKDTAPASWVYIAKKWAPLTEVIGGAS